MSTAQSTRPLAMALLEVSNLGPALMVADRCVKTSGVEIIGIESADSAAQTIKLAGSAADVRAAGEAGLALALEMGATASLVVIPGPLPEVADLARQAPQFSPLLGIYDARVPRKPEPNDQNDDNSRNTAMNQAIGLLETQGLVAALQAADEMLKSASVTLAGKEKIGAAYITIMVRGDVAAVQAAIATGKEVVERLGGKLIMAGVIPRPHADLASLLPK